MGATIFLITRSEDIEKEDKYNDLSESRNCKYLSEALMTLIDGLSDDSEFSQIEQILDIDLSIYRKVPESIRSEVIEKLEEDLFNAEYDNETEKILEIEKKILSEKERIKNESEISTNGWTKISQMRETTKLLLDKLTNSEDLQHKIKYSFENYWDNYFSKTPKAKESEWRFEDDLKTIICKLNCMDEAGFEYVCLAID